MARCTAPTPVSDAELRPPSIIIKAHGALIHALASCPTSCVIVRACVRAAPSGVLQSCDCEHDASERKMPLAAPRKPVGTFHRCHSLEAIAGNKHEFDVFY